MAEEVAATAFEYELYDRDPDRVKTVVATPDRVNPWIDRGVLKLSHRIGRGPFGDVWIATQHQSGDDYDEYHEVAIKMLHPIRENQMRAFLVKFEDIFSKCQGLRNVCFLHGISELSGKMCIAMKFYEGSIGDKMAHLKGGKLSLADFLRYGTELAQGILELHARGILVLNLKPSNFLLDEHDQAILGDFGIPLLLLGIPLLSSDVAIRLGTPNYMAPEQWQPEIRGPISFETDSWGFACSIVEMLSGIQPWCGKSAQEIYQLVVIKQEKPIIPSGLPPAMEKVISGCFEYDLRNRPLIADVLQVFKSCKNTVYDDEDWTSLRNSNLEKLSRAAYTEWFLSKDQLQVGDAVRSRKPANSCKPETMFIPEGTVVGMESDVDRGSFVLVRVHGIHNPLRVHSSTLERVTSGFAAGDWVRVREEDRQHSPVGILHSIDRDGRVTVGFIGMETLWRGSCSELQMAESYCVGQFVRVKMNVFSPRFEWPRKRGGEWVTGRIWQVLPNGCLLVRFPSKFVFGEDLCCLADPAEVEVVCFNNCQGLVKKYQHLEDFHWSVRPLVIALGLFAALKLGVFMGSMRRSRPRTTVKSIPRRKRGGGALVQGDSLEQDGQTGSNPPWLPPSVANIFREGVGTAR
eukprot:TRINITY_DN2860_c0_g1_i1.p2 TRINITY_DN2860_c0_g1~~TRINITY_DN2860_c0_g1_i1.p2  ORF type:complete len:632 (-),score=109.76 TRINITY_DN2860_c0_g1_i1:843-2738(-)